jgi:hypothetical protein
MASITEAGITKFPTGRTYDFDQVLEIVFVEKDDEEHHFYVEDKSRIMKFVVTLDIDEPEKLTMEDISRMILNKYDKCDYNKAGWEVEMRGREIFQAASQQG